VFIGIALTPPFGLQLTGQWYLAVPLLLIGTLSFLSIGLLVGSIAKTDEAAQAMANFLMLPMASCPAPSSTSPPPRAGCRRCPGSSRCAG
jgi:hypothetical protein